NFFFSSRRRHTRCLSDWSSDVCSSDLGGAPPRREHAGPLHREGPGAGARRGRRGGDAPAVSSQGGGIAQSGGRDASAESAGARRSEERRVGKERGPRRWRQQEQTKRTD